MLVKKALNMPMYEKCWKDMLFCQSYGISKQNFIPVNDIRCLELLDFKCKANCVKTVFLEMGKFSLCT